MHARVTNVHVNIIALCWVLGVIATVAKVSNIIFYGCAT